MLRDEALPSNCPRSNLRAELHARRNLQQQRRLHVTRVREERLRAATRKRLLAEMYARADVWDQRRLRVSAITINAAAYAIAMGVKWEQAVR